MAEILTWWTPWKKKSQGFAFPTGPLFKWFCTVHVSGQHASQTVAGNYRSLFPAHPLLKGFLCVSQSFASAWIRLYSGFPRPGIAKHLLAPCRLHLSLLEGPRPGTHAMGETILNCIGIHIFLWQLFTSFVMYAHIIFSAMLVRRVRNLYVFLFSQESWPPPSKKGKRKQRLLPDLRQDRS